MMPVSEWEGECKSDEVAIRDRWEIFEKKNTTSRLGPQVYKFKKVVVGRASVLSLKVTDDYYDTTVVMILPSIRSYISILKKKKKQ